MYVSVPHDLSEGIKKGDILVIEPCRKLKPNDIGVFVTESDEIQIYKQSDTSLLLGRLVKQIITY